VAELADSLGPRALVELVRVDGWLHAVTVAGGRARWRRLGAAADVDKELASLRLGLRSLAMARAGSRVADSMGDVCAQVAARLDALLIEPLRGDVEDRPLVLVPTGELHALPWSMLPSLAHRPLEVVPSLRLWHRAAQRAAPAGGPAVLVAGPRLPEAQREIETLAARHPRARALTGDAATVAAVAQALDGADSAHLAAHGRFRDDNPLFCSLELADGALTVYDLERLRAAPRRLVLSSCESGLSAVHAGDELMGFTAAVFALGTATVIAAVVPVPDEATHGLMLALDEELTNGTPPAHALARARERLEAGDRRHQVARAAFVCFGAG
jgi:CHAT domain-containing protein